MDAKRAYESIRDHEGAPPEKPEDNDTAAWVAAVNKVVALNIRHKIQEK